MRFGVDVGGTSIKIGVVQNHKIIEKFSIPTKSDSFLEDICTFIKTYADEHNQKIEGIGFGLPGNVRKNFIHDLPNMKVSNIDLLREVKKYLPGVRVMAGNDANVAALGEMIFHNECKNACLITLGTGVGCGIVLDGKILEGVHGDAGEIGHMIIADDYHFQCGCGLNGCLETVASATGIVRLARYHFNDFTTKLKEVFTAKDVCDLAKVGDPLCSFVLEKVCYYIAKSISILSVVIDVEVYYIGGGVSLAGDILIEGIKAQYKKLAHFAVKDVKIEAAALLNDAGMLGASELLN